FACCPPAADGPPGRIAARAGPSSSVAVAGPRVRLPGGRAAEGSADGGPEAAGPAAGEPLGLVPSCARPGAGRLRGGWPGAARPAAGLLAACGPPATARTRTFSPSRAVSAPVRTRSCPLLANPLALPSLGNAIVSTPPSSSCTLAVFRSIQATFFSLLTRSRISGQRWRSASASTGPVPP